MSAGFVVMGRASVNTKMAVGSDSDGDSTYD